MKTEWREYLVCVCILPTRENVLETVGSEADTRA